MKADFTRNTFDPFQHFDRVLLQQGRVQLDADWNEQGAILLHYLRTLAADLIGLQGGPSANLGFGLSLIHTTPPIAGDFRIGLGRYYVDGILCEADARPVGFTVSANNANAIQVDQWTIDGSPFQANEWVEVFDDVQVPVSPAFPPTVVQISNPDQANRMLTLQGAPPFGTPHSPKVRRVYTYLTQPDYPVPEGALLASSAAYLIYLDVWQRLITYIEDDAIREVALGGPDTATRAKVVCQVKAVPGRASDATGGVNAGANPCENFIPTDSGFLTKLFGGNRGRLRARAKQTSASANPCIIPPGASYTGPENQLYRVEIHRSGDAWDRSINGKSVAATFKWSRENGSVVFPVSNVASASGMTTVTLESLGRDDRFGLAEGDWVEIQDDVYVLLNRAETMLHVQSIDRTGMTATLNGASTSGVGMDAGKHPLLRRWDYEAGDPADGGLQLSSDMAALVIEDAGGAWLNLEDGVQIRFDPPDTAQPPNQYRTGDYWLIPARTATGDVEWLTEMGKDSQGNAVTVHLAKPPDGIDHHYAPLGVVSVATDGNIVAAPGDCRKHFDPLAHS